jgi:hypothetical protein
MVSADQLIQTIERNLDRLGPYSRWTVGVTSDPEKRQRDLEFPAFWRYWEAASPEDARKIETCWLERGMQGDPNDDPKATCVYVY